MRERVVVVGMGASTPIGRDAWSSAAAVRAGISGFAQHPYMIDSAGEPMRVAIASWLDDGIGGVERMEALLLPAVVQALEPIDSIQGAALSVALALGLPDRKPGVPEDLGRQMLGFLSQRCARKFTSATTFPEGHVACLLALEAACDRLSQGSVDACVVAGVDSHLQPETLEWIEECDQLHGAGPLNNAWGFIPGEAAGALLVMRERTALSLNLEPLAVVLGTGRAHEQSPIKTETVCIGAGLTETFKSALAALPAGARVTDVYCDMNGESYRADEYGFTGLRTKEYFESASDFVAPADCWGDVAAAGAVLHLILASVAGRKGYAKGPLAFVWASAEKGARAAALISTDLGGA